MNIKRVKLDDFTLKTVEGTPTLFLNSKAVYPHTVRLRGKEKAAIIETGENIRQYSPYAANIQTTYEDRHATVQACLQVIFKELSTLQRFLAGVNEEIKRLSREKSTQFLSIQINAEGTVLYTTTQDTLMPISRYRFTGKTNEGAVFITAAVGLPYLNLDSANDLFKMYRKCLFVGKV